MFWQAINADRRNMIHGHLIYNCTTTLTGLKSSSRSLLISQESLKGKHYFHFNCDMKKYPLIKLIKYHGNISAELIPYSSTSGSSLEPHNALPRLLMSIFSLCSILNFQRQGQSFQSDIHTTLIGHSFFLNKGTKRRFQAYPECQRKSSSGDNVV